MVLLSVRRTSPSGYRGTIGPLFRIEPSVAAKDRAVSRLEQHHDSEIQALVPLALEVALRAGLEGCTVGDIRLVAQRRELLPQCPEGRALSWLTVLPKRAGLVPTGRRRMSPIPKSRNVHTIYLHPQFDGPWSAA